MIYYIIARALRRLFGLETVTADELKQRLESWPPESLDLLSLAREDLCTLVLPPRSILWQELNELETPQNEGDKATSSSSLRKRKAPPPDSQSRSASAKKRFHQFSEALLRNGTKLRLSPRKKQPKWIPYCFVGGLDDDEAARAPRRRATLDSSSCDAETRVGLAANRSSPSLPLLSASAQKERAGRAGREESASSSFSGKKTLNANPLGATPAVCFVNPKSGGQEGTYVLRALRGVLHPTQIINLKEKVPLYEPLDMLRWFVKTFGGGRLRIVVCGGDGTVDWVINIYYDLNRL